MRPAHAAVVAFPPLASEGFADHEVCGVGAASSSLAPDAGDGAGSGCGAAGGGRAPERIQLLPDPRAGLLTSSLLAEERRSWRVPLPERVIRERGAAC